MNSFLDKVKSTLGATMSKVLLISFGSSFLFTLLISIVSGNKISVAISKSIVGAAVIVAVFYAIYLILMRILDDVLNEMGTGNKELTDDLSAIEEFVNKDTLEDTTDDTEESKISKPLEIVSGQVVEPSSKTEQPDEKEDFSNFDIGASFEPAPKTSSHTAKASAPTIDKKAKVSYDNKASAGFVDFSNNDDIGSIIFSDKVKEAVSSDSKKSSSQASSPKADNNDGFIDFSKAAKSNPDMMAKAIRSMRSRDKE